EPGQRRWVESGVQKGGAEREPFLTHRGSIVERSPAVVEPHSGKDVVDGEIALESAVQREVQHAHEIAQCQGSRHDQDGRRQPHAPSWHPCQSLRNHGGITANLPPPPPPPPGGGGERKNPC